jgi:hypothetical protein
MLSVMMASLVLTGAAAAELKAQTVNPSKIAWDAADHAITTRYEVGYFMPGATAPVQVASIAPSVVAAVGTGYETALPRPVMGTYAARLKACAAVEGGTEVCSDWSNSTDPFLFSPRVPTQVVARP